MEPWIIAIIIRPLVYLLLFVLIVAPITWLLYKIIPDGKFKVFLFKIRSGEFATRRDKIIMTFAVILSYAFLGSALYFGFK